MSLVGGAAELLSPSPIDLAEPGGKPAVHVRGGTVPVKTLLAVEEIELFALLGTGTREGRLDLRLGPALSLRSAQARLRGVFRGRAVVEAFREDDTKLQMRSGAAEVRLRGRLFAESDRSSFPQAAFRLEGTGSEGFLADLPVRLQVVAAPSRRATVRLDGTSMDRPPPQFVDRDLWGRTAPDPRTAPGLAFAERAGLLPPGIAFEVQRIVWRARFEGDNGRVDVNAPRLPQPIRVRASDAGAHDGEWTGKIVVGPGEEPQISLSAQNGATGEAVFYGRLVPR